MKQKLQSFILLTCCLLVAVGPFNVLQTVAWGNMLHDYSSGRTFSEAAEMTFSGDYPCEMCRRIAEAKSWEDKKQSPKPFPAEERLSLRLVFSYEQDEERKDLHWPDPSISLSPGEAIITLPSSRELRVPTPPPQV